MAHDLFVAHALAREPMLSVFIVDNRRPSAQTLVPKVLGVPPNRP